jgi:hypothetical protein
MSHETMLSRTAGGDGKSELRCDIPKDELSVLDGFCNGTDRSRTDVIREILAEWSGKKLREATVICRVAGVNPIGLDMDRAK